MSKGTTVWSVCTLALLMVCTPHHAAADVLPDEVLRLERDGKFEEAKGLLATIKSADAEAHLALLAEVERAELIERDYLDRQMTAQAQQALESVISKLNVLRDVYLVLRVQRAIDEIRTRGSDEVMASALLDRADGLLATGAYARAKEVYAAVAMSNPAEVGASVVARSRRGIVAADRAALDAEPRTFVAELLHPMPATARTLSQWLVWGTIALALLVAAGTIRRRVLLRRGNIIELFDLTASGEARAPANHELNHALNAAIQRMIGAGVGRGSATLEAYSAPDGVSSSEDGGLVPSEGLGFVDPELQGPELAKFNEIVQVAPVVQLGPVGLNPRQLWELIRWFFTPTFRHSVTGTLFESDGHIVLHVSYVDRLKNRQVHRWRATAPAAGGRAACLIDVAAQMVLANAAGASVTSDCDSLRNYVAGLDALAAGVDNPSSLEVARTMLQRSVTLDATNWLARFHLGIVLRKIGDTASAARQLKALDDVIEGVRDGRSEEPGFESLRAYCDQRPDFPYIVRYHLASALAQSGDADNVKQARAQFLELINLPDAPHSAGLQTVRLRHLEMLGRSGETALLVPQLQEKSMGPVEKRIDAHMAWFEQNSAALELASAADHSVARGIVLHAFGRFQYLHGNFRRAIKALKEATILVPRFPDPHVNLASVYLKWKGKAAQDWPLHVKAALDRALAVDPMHGKARYIYAKFYYSDAVRDLAKAEAYLRDSLPHSGTLFLYGQVLEAQGKYVEALQALERSFAMEEQGVDFRVRLYANCALEAARGGAPLGIMERSRQRLDQYRRTVEDANETIRLTELLHNLDAEIEERRRTVKSDAPSARPAPPDAPAPAPV